MSEKVKAINCILAMLLICACRTLPTADTENNTQLSWLPLPDSTRVHGAALLVHGLNDRPQILDEIALELSKQGIHSLRVALSGHGEGQSLNNHNLIQNWSKNIQHGFNLAKQKYPDLPIYNLSFSLGSALTLNFLDTQYQVGFDKMIFLAPAVALTRTANLINVLLPFRFLNISLPSRNLEKYRAHRKTPLIAYQAALKIIKRVNTLQYPQKLASIPTLIIANSKDEVVSLKGIEYWLKRNQLDWKIKQICPQPKTAGIAAHIIFNRDSLGDREWERTMKMLSDFLM